VGDGLSCAVYTQIKDEKREYLVCARWITSIQQDLNIIEFEKDRLKTCLLNNRYDIIHYYKGINSDILKLVLNVVAELNQKIPVVTTVCQRPSYRSLLLSPYEIKKSSHFVFIDKTSYNDPIVNFIPQERKSQIYLVSNTYKLLSEGVDYSRKKNNLVIFGRATTLIKCPIDMFEIFDQIDYQNKEFHIVGVPKDGNWVAEEAKKRNNVVMHGFVSFDRWVEICKTFDVFLYQLPEMCHSSIDGNLGLAMWMKIPVVYYGPEAPKERFDHGCNGYVATNKEEIIQYSTLLAVDYNLRKQIGQAGRDSIELKIGTIEDKLHKYNLVYTKCFDSNMKSIKIPFLYYFTYIKKAWKRIIRGYTGSYRKLG